MMDAKLILVALLSLALAACSNHSGFADLDRFMKEVDEKPRGKLDPLPELKVYRAFTYSAAGSRSPFLPPQDVALQEIKIEPKENGVKPNLDRAKEVLESFSLTQLAMVGTLQRAQDAGLIGLIADNTGGVHMVKPGQHMGKNHGRIVGLTESRVDLVEIVPNGHGGWLERPRSISINEVVN